MKMRGFDRINDFLPDELMVEIFRYLDLNENREAASLVCKRWLGLVRLSRETIRIGFSASTDDLVELLTDRFVNVRDVSIDEFPLSSLARKFGGPRPVNQCPLIGKSAYEENGSRKCCLTDYGLAAVGDGFTKLESLKLMWCPNVTDVGLISIAEKCKLLKSLDLQECCVRDKGLAAIGEYCTRLEDLNLWRCNSLTDTGLAQLALGCGRTLKSLGLDACQSLTDVSLEAVGFHCKSLESLSLDSEFIHDNGLLAVAKGCTQLKSLKLECSNVTDEALQAVGSFCLLLELLALYSCGQLTDKLVILYYRNMESPLPLEF